MVFVWEIQESTRHTLTTMSAQILKSAYYCRAVNAAIGKLGLVHQMNRLTDTLPINQSEVLSTMDDHGRSGPLSNVIRRIPFLISSPIVNGRSHHFAIMFSLHNLELVSRTVGGTRPLQLYRKHR
jgi:hypothetical protein